MNTAEQLRNRLWDAREAESFLYVRRPDDPTVAMTSANAWNGGKTPPDLTCTSCTDARTRPLSPRWSMRTGDDAGPQTDRALQRREPSAERVSVLDLSRDK